MKSTVFEDQTFDKINYSGRSPEEGIYENCSFRNCIFSGSYLSEIRFIETDFIECDFSNASLINTSFNEVVFKNCKMLGLQFDQCNSLTFSALFDNCILNHSSFYKMNLPGISFIRSQCQSVDFTDAVMTKSKINECDLLNSVFENTNIENADIRGSYNYSIDPEINRIKGAGFSMPEVLGLLDKYDIQIDEN